MDAMVRLARAQVFDLADIAIAHVYNRTVKRCFLMGDDAVSGKNFDHRKVWIEGYLLQFAAAFGIDLLGFARMNADEFATMIGFTGTPAHRSGVRRDHGRLSDAEVRRMKVPLDLNIIIDSTILG